VGRDYCRQKKEPKVAGTENNSVAPDPRERASRQKRGFAKKRKAQNTIKTKKEKMECIDGRYSAELSETSKKRGELRTRGKPGGRKFSFWSKVRREFRRRRPLVLFIEDGGSTLQFPKKKTSGERLGYLRNVYVCRSGKNKREKEKG